MRLSWLLLALAPVAFAQDTQPSASADSESLFWGAYRPGLYFGLRPRAPQSLMTGLIWFGAYSYNGINEPRHACDERDGLYSYTWTEYDVREGGIQVLDDGKNNVRLTTELLKVPGGEHGGSWAARIKGEPIDPEQSSKISVIPYFGIEGLGGLEMETDEDESGLEGPVKYSGSATSIGDFTIRVVDGPNNQYVTEGPFARDFDALAGKTYFGGFRVPAGNIWQSKEVIHQSIIRLATTIIEPYHKADPTKIPEPAFALRLPNEAFSGSNLHALQKTFDGPFQLDIFFESASAHHHLSASTLDEGIPALSDAFAKRFAATFPLSPDTPEGRVNFSKEITANILGGVGYFYGTSIVDPGFAHEWDQEEGTDDEDKQRAGAHLTEPRALLTATPSRSFFPRGFYWDEGFHLLHIGEWDNALSLEILKQWVDLIDDDGWVAREQILGEEARSRVPPEFQTQVPTYANPPTLTMAVTAFIDRLQAYSSGISADELGLGGAQTAFSIPEEETVAQQLANRHLHSHEEAIAYLNSIYPALKRHYDWFRRTQRGAIKQYGRKARSRTEAYRWRGRSEQHVLTSGMDDYPRGPPHAGELHLDLISWMGFFSRTMKRIAGFLGHEDDEASYAEIEQAILDNIDDLHWNEEEQMYCDVNVNADDESYHVCHRGYLSLFPFLLGLLPPSSPHLGPVLDLLRSPEHLWSDYGLRSLSLSHPEFGQGENYWKGPIWMQMNYLALSSLYKIYMPEDGPHRQRAEEIYTELRKNVVDNVYKEYERTGYTWEQYNALTGEGQRSHPFTGWTSLITLIMSEKY